MVVAFLAGALVADVVRARVGAAFFAAAFIAAALAAGAFFGGAFFAAAAFAVGLRMGVAVVAEVFFFRATRTVVGVGFTPGLSATLAPVAHMVDAAENASPVEGVEAPEPRTPTPPSPAASLSVSRSSLCATKKP